MKSKNKFWDSIQEIYSFFKCILIILTLTTPVLLWARESTTFELGKSVHVLSDKAFRKTKENLFEAVGNVIITKDQDALYGDKASISMLTGKSYVEGNARYIGNNLTAYGTKITYNFKSDLLDIENARVISDNYVVLGERISRIAKNIMVAENAEYTTCKDCPESWSILGRKVHITTGEYIRITHAYIKISGVVVMYVPYIILPIKKKRETGLLFPNFSLDFKEGINFSQPWFFAISDHQDLTLIPKFFGKRGSGAHTEYRKSFGEKSWIEINSLNTFDRIYRKNIKDETNEDGSIVFSGNSEYRTYNDIESLLTLNNSWRFYTNTSWPDDLDMFRDYDDHLPQTPLGSETGIDGFLNYRTNLVDFNLESYFNRNILTDDSSSFDHRYVQILPRFSYSLLPVNIFQSDLPFFRSLNLYSKGDYTIFKQNHLLENDLIRNAHRLNNNINLEWNLGHFGPVNLRTSAKLDSQYYQFPYEKFEKSFYKYGLVYETEAKIELSKIYGIAKNRVTKKSDLLSADDDISLIEKQKSESRTLFNLGLVEVIEDKQSETIGSLPPIQGTFEKDEDIIIRSSSHRHLQTFKLRHLYLGNQKTSGSSRFYNQISNFDGAGQFDSNDAIIDKKNELTETTSKVELPVNNTIEVSWNNSLIKKDALKFNIFQDGKSIRENFEFRRVSYFNVSQGLDLYTEKTELEDQLTRLKITTGVSNNLFNLSLSEYYFYNNNKHILNMSFAQSFSYFNYDINFVYDSFSFNRDIVIKAKLDVLPRISLEMKYDYNLQDDEINYTRYSVLYSPSNKCWKMDVHYSTNKIKKKFSFNFYINFNDNKFTGLSGL